MRRKFVLDLSFFLLLHLVTFAPVGSFLATSTVSSKSKATRVDCRLSTSLPPSLSRLRTSTRESPSVQLPNSRPYLFTILTALAIAISYADRTNLSTSIIPMTDQYGWDASTSGLVLSSFWLGYGSSQVIGGKVADRYSGEWLLVFAIVAWSVCTGLVPVVADADISGLIALRVLLGVAEGLALPAVHSMLSVYIPKHQQSTSASVITAACYTGALLSNLITPVLIERSGWESSFYTFATLPFLWVPMWMYYISLNKSSSNVSTHASTSRLTSKGLDSEDDGIVSRSDDEMSIKELLSMKPVCAIMLAQYGQGVGNIGLLSWLPTYYSQHFNVPLSNLASFTVLPYFLQMFIAVSAGKLADYMIVNNVLGNKLRVRNLFQMVGSFLPAFFLLTCVYGSPVIEHSSTIDVESSERLITLGSACTALTVASVSCYQFDISPRNAGTIFALGNTASCIGGLLAVPITGYIYDTTGSWDLVFALFAFHYVVFGGFAWLSLTSKDDALFE